MWLSPFCVVFVAATAVGAAGIPVKVGATRFNIRGWSLFVLVFVAATAAEGRTVKNAAIKTPTTLLVTAILSG
jgi:hypothetical protein